MSFENNIHILSQVVRVQSLLETLAGIAILKRKKNLTVLSKLFPFFKYAGRRKFGWTITKNITLLQCRWLELCRSESKLHFLLTRSIFRVLNRA